MAEIRTLLCAGWKAKAWDTCQLTSIDFCNPRPPAAKDTLVIKLYDHNELMFYCSTIGWVISKSLSLKNQRISKHFQHVQSLQNPLQMTHHTQHLLDVHVLMDETCCLDQQAARNGRFDQASTSWTLSWTIGLNYLQIFFATLWKGNKMRDKSEGFLMFCQSRLGQSALLPAEWPGCFIWSDWLQCLERIKWPWLWVKTCSNAGDHGSSIFLLPSWGVLECFRYPGMTCCQVVEFGNRLL